MLHKVVGFCNTRIEMVLEIEFVRGGVVVPSRVNFGDEMYAKALAVHISPVATFLVGYSSSSWHSAHVFDRDNHRLLVCKVVEV